MFVLKVDRDLEIRQFSESDAETLFALADRNRASLREWLPWALEYSPEKTRPFIQSGLEKFARNQGFDGGLWLNGSLAGGIGVHAIDWAHRHTSLGYWLDAGCRGRGVVTRATRAVAGYLFDDLGLNRIEIRCGTGNRKSRAIPERLGFSQEGILREAQWIEGRPIDLVVYSLLRREWTAR